MMMMAESIIDNSDKILQRESQNIHRYHSEINAQINYFSDELSGI
jgi:hypothetical protein